MLNEITTYKHIKNCYAIYIYDCNHKQYYDSLIFALVFPPIESHSVMQPVTMLGQICEFLH